MQPFSFKTRGVLFHLSSGYPITFRGLHRMYRETKNGDVLSLVMSRIRSHINYARWQIFGVSALFLVSFALFLTG
jgi:hypothetical protein